MCVCVVQKNQNTNHYSQVAYRNRPPLLEDVSIQGPLHIPVKDAMQTLEERGAIEAGSNISGNGTEKTTAVRSRHRHRVVQIC